MNIALIVNFFQRYLPSFCECPGTNYSWTYFNEKNCSGVKPICKSNFSKLNKFKYFLLYYYKCIQYILQANTDCTSNSVCIENGPGNFNCNCKENFHGYKCLNEVRN